MDRLSALTIGLLLVAACDGGDAPTVSRERVQSVKARPSAGPDLAAFCDVLPRDEAGRPFPSPALSEGSLPAGGWRWINVWATWCVPCVEEIPLVRDFKDRLAGAGKRVELVLLSADEEASTVARFRKSHPGTPNGPRLRHPDDMPAFIESVGLDAGATLPIHVFVDPQGSIRCVRTGAIGRNDYAAIERLLGG